MLRDQLEHGRLQLALALLTEYPYAGEIGEVRIIEISHCSVFSFRLNDVLLLKLSNQLVAGSLVSALKHLALTFWGGVKDLKMLVGEPFRPMVVGSISGSSFRVL